MTGYTTTGVVRFSETDASGRFHYSAALIWAENAEHNLYRDAGIAVSDFPRRAVSAEFVSPLVDGDEYTVELSVDRLGTTSVTYAWRILARGVLAVTGSHTVVHVGSDGRSATLPEDLRAVLED